MGYTVVTKVIPGGAADKHGKLKPEDKIVSVGQETGDMVDVDGHEVERRCQNDPWTRGYRSCRLGVIHEGETEDQHLQHYSSKNSADGQ